MIRATKLGIWALATVARRSCKCRVTVERQLCVRIEKGTRLLGGARLLESVRLLRLLRLLEGTTMPAAAAAWHFPAAWYLPAAWHLSQFSRITVVRLLCDIRMTVMRQSQVPQIPNQSQFSFIGRQPLTKLSHISRTFWLTEIKLRRIQDTRDDSVTILRENLPCDFFFFFLTCFKKSQIPATCERIPATHARKLRKPANV